MQALPGFLMLLTGEGKLLYLSDSVSEHLGHSMVRLLLHTQPLQPPPHDGGVSVGLDLNVSLCFSGGSRGTRRQRL